MPRPPKTSQTVAAMPAAVFSPVAHRAAEVAGPVFPLHVGDTWLEPFEGARMEALRVAEHPGMHRYCETAGLPPLLEALVEKLRARNRLAVGREDVLVTAGATSGISCAVAALTDPGEEVLILAPFWPLVRGIVRSQRAVPVEVPFFDRVHSAGDAVAAIEERLSPRSVALYFSNPSNPSGRVLPRAWLEALAELARRADLWVISDEVYEDYVYRGEHASFATLAPERTISVFSFSKAYGMAGNRVGYLAAPGGLAARDPQGAAALELPRGDRRPARRPCRDRGRGRVGRRRPRELPRRRRGRGARARAPAARGLDVPLRRRRRAARRARHGGAPRGLPRGRGPRRAGRLERRGIRRLDPPLLLVAPAAGRGGGRASARRRPQDAGARLTDWITTGSLGTPS